jgi:hypothetical protein
MEVREKSLLHLYMGNSSVDIGNSLCCVRLSVGD